MNRLPSPRYCPFCGSQDFEITTSPLPSQNITCPCGRRCRVEWWDAERAVAPPYEEKFAALIEACKNAKADGATRVVVASPGALGDTYEEITESLHRIADAGADLGMPPRKGPAT